MGETGAGIGDTDNTGGDISVTVVTAEPGTDAVCYLAAYDDNGALVRVNARRVALTDSVTELAFPDFADLSVRAVKSFLTDGETLPAALSAEFIFPER